MSIPTEIDSHEIDLVYLVANTPAFLYKHLRHNNSVQWMAAKFSIDELCRIYQELRTPSGRNNFPVSLSYAVITALSLKEYSVVSEVLRGLPVEGLDWGRIFLDIVLSQSIPTSQTVLTIPPRSAKSSRLDIATSTSDVIITRERR
ncbi:MAG: hypothetical protein KGS09_20855 [Nitrospirae bacterium]|nr:hypothetical protein [Nitrospirota bacterium]